MSPRGCLPGAPPQRLEEPPAAEEPQPAAAAAVAFKGADVVDQGGDYFVLGGPEVETKEAEPEEPQQPLG